MPSPAAAVAARSASREAMATNSLRSDRRIAGITVRTAIDAQPSTPQRTGPLRSGEPLDDDTDRTVTRAASCLTPVARSGNVRRVTTARLPSGTQHELVCGDTSATVVEVGAALRRCAIGGAEVVDGFERTERCTDYRGQTLVPWPNRLRDGRYRFGDAEHELPLSEPSRGNALHGLILWLPFAAERAGDDRVTMR